MKSIALFIAMLALSVSCIAQQAIGQWRGYPSFREVLDVIDLGDNKVFARTKTAAFTYDDASGEVTTYSRSTSLSDTDLSAIGFDPVGGRLLIGYTNGSIDLVYADRVVNLPDIKQSGIVGNLSITSFEVEEERLWASTGFGIVLIDMDAEEVIDSYILGVTGNGTLVNDFLLKSDSVFAATETGFFKASRASNLADFNNWLADQSLDRPNAAYDNVLAAGDRIYLHESSPQEVIYSREGGLWINKDEDTDIINVDFTNERLVVTRRLSISVRLADFTEEFSVFSALGDDSLEPFKAVQTEDGALYIAEKRNALIRFLGSDEQSIRPSGPFSDVAWSVDSWGGNIWLAHGRYEFNYNLSFSDEAFSGQKDGRWIELNEHPRFTEMSEGIRLRDVIQVEVDPSDPSHIFFAAYQGGLLEYFADEGRLEILNIEEGGANLDYSGLNPERIQAAGLHYDIQGNLWVMNAYTADPFKVRKADGDWTSFACLGGIDPSQEVEDVIVTERGQSWVVLPRGNGVAVLQHDFNFDNPSAAQCKKIGTGAGEGGLPTTSVFAVAEDKDGEIWVGTSEGPVVNYSPTSIFTSDPADFQPILVERDGNVERLLAGEVITCIEIDGANRKWLGTLSGGAFLLSEDGGDEILHFTENDSPLLDNYVRDISIDPVTGEVHFATNSGLITYKGDATEGIAKNECYDVYPNPVRPDYSGPITIDGLFENSEVKITDVAGNIVFQTIANGGRAIWQGTNFQGQRVSTGVYFALVSDRDGETSCVSKILFIN